MKKPLTFLDLFCGCGGFTLGMQRAGFNCLAALDFNSQAITTLKKNLPTIPNVLECDLTQFNPEQLSELIKTRTVDVVVGGPPCQGFSTARQRDGANHGVRLKEDSRRLLYREFLRYIEFFQPRIFVMENVLGIRSAAGGAYFTAVQKEARALGHSKGKVGYRVHSQIEDAWELGVPQKRRRQLIIGVRNDLPGYFLPELKPAPRAEPRTWLGAAIGDLPILRAGGGEDEREYDLERREKHLRDGGNTAANYVFKVLEIKRASKLTNHVSRPHSERDLRDFALIKEGENSATAMRDRNIAFEFPYDKTSFKDRYTRQSRWKACSTIVAHLSKDGLMFIHPTQNRSLTPREAARIQSFPDWFRFPEARTHSFRLIGNAVPPLIGEAIGLAVKKFLNNSVGTTSTSSHSRAKRGEQSEHLPESVHKIETHYVRRALRENGTRWNASLPVDRPAAALELQKIARLDRLAMRALPKEEFLRGWRALLFLFPDLHPDNALDHGDAEEPLNAKGLLFPGLSENRYARSGWPVALELIGLEAWRRRKAKEITDQELYCSASQHAGLHALRKVSSAA